MQEFFLGRKKASSNYDKNPNDYYYFLDFRNDALGTKVLTDRSPNKFVLPATGNTAAAGFGVTDLANIGRCFRFVGSAWFFAMPDILNDFSLSSYDMEFGYVKPDGVSNTIFSSGNWYSNFIESGIAVNAGSAGFEVFTMNASNNTYSRPGVGWTDDRANLLECVIQKRKTGTVVKNLTKNVQSSGAFFAIPGDTYTMIGGTRGASTGFVGYLKYLRIKKIVD